MKSSNSFILLTSLPDIPQSLRATWLTRFAREIAPEYVPAFGQKALSLSAAE
jgi:hypothetical protein